MKQPYLLQQLRKLQHSTFHKVYKNISVFLFSSLHKKNDTIHPWNSKFFLFANCISTSTPFTHELISLIATVNLRGWKKVLVQML